MYLDLTDSENQTETDISTFHFNAEGGCCLNAESSCLKRCGKSFNDVIGPACLCMGWTNDRRPRPAASAVLGACALFPRVMLHAAAARPRLRRKTHRY
ncbi:hypothetical protein EVAR_102606_1 [Eumeta japonica]|uniref:Uncharacterized protein n=1 Tax=Eumeta variegata TaxID=151549 RepID=A0A4C1TV33_EUMVA|nr:hypothetical protein EVAR_102606_1 [Eumeta japonica]